MAFVKTRQEAYQLLQSWLNPEQPQPPKKNAVPNLVKFLREQNPNQNQPQVSTMPPETIMNQAPAEGLAQTQQQIPQPKSRMFPFVGQ